MLNFIYTLIFHRRIIKRLEAELMEPLEVRLESFKAFVGAVDVKMTSPVVSIMAQAMIDLYRSVDGAKNFVSLEAQDRKTLERFELVIQRKEGKTPLDAVSELRVELNEALDALRNILDEQNDAPLERRRAQWQAAMGKSIEILNKHSK